MRFLSLLAGTLLLLHPAAIRAQTVWDMPTEYPENAMPGVGLAAFTRHVTELGAGKLTIKPSFEYGGSKGNLNYFVDGSYNHNNIGIENPTSSHDPIHDVTIVERNRDYAPVGAATPVEPDEPPPSPARPLPHAPCPALRRAQLSPHVVLRALDERDAS